jgi:hypothetical protein
MEVDDRQRRLDQLYEELRSLDRELWDEELGAELYRALTNRVWRRVGAEDELALSWSAAAELVDRLRADVGRRPLELEASGSEGELSDRVARLLGERGWSSRPLDTSRHEDAHVGRGGEPAVGPQLGRHLIPLHVRDPALAGRLVEAVHDSGHREAVMQPRHDPETWDIALEADSREAASQVVWGALQQLQAGDALTFLHAHDLPQQVKR